MCTCEFGGLLGPEEGVRYPGLTAGYELPGLTAGYELPDVGVGI